MIGLDILRMLAAIHLNDDPPIEADEVQIVTSKRRLPANVKPAFAKSLKARP